MKGRIIGDTKDTPQKSKIMNQLLFLRKQITIELIPRCCSLGVLPHLATHSIL